MSTKYAKTGTEDLVEIFRTAAADRGEALKNADPKKANNLYRLMVAVYREIKQRGLQAQRQMLLLLSDESVAVRLSAGTYALEFDPQSAEPILERILDQEQGLLKFTARMVLMQWRKGELKFPD